jgi:hypothetical protein
MTKVVQRIQSDLETVTSQIAKDLAEGPHFVKGEMFKNWAL